MIDNFQQEGQQNGSPDVKFTDAPWYVPNTVIRRDLKVFSVRQEVHNYSVTYRHRHDDHPNRLAKSLFQEPAPNRRLKRYYPADLATTFQLVIRENPSGHKQSLVIALQ